MSNSASRKPLALALSIGLVLLASLVSQPASATTPWDSTSFDPSGELESPNTSNASTASFTATTPASPASIDSSNVQIYGFQDPGLGSPVKTQVGNGVLLVDGAFSVLVSASGMVLQTSAVGVQWQAANAPAPASLTVYVNLPSNLNGSISYEFGPGSLAKDSNSTNPYLVVVGSTGGSAFYVSTKNYAVQGNQQNVTPPTRTAATTTPTYRGPSFDSPSRDFNQGESVSLSGKRMSGIYSITIDGNKATISSVTDTSIVFELPSNLVPGIYDLEVLSSEGRLTQLAAIKVKASRKSFAYTTKSLNRLGEAGIEDHALVATVQESALNKARCIVNASSLVEAKLQAQKLCAAIRNANPKIDQIVIEPRSTVTGRMVYARVIYGWTSK